ncbi:hypothetical protein N8J89_29910 [Crossiella sp. CA-258035]|uniref:hypothetical protein n=1 Tax=Crossiella sp. CA-258035 TaxID=2981138 RepID=UPI0024BD14AD|nr:hypothetical protein [Crossiella sp. CA-258035]WHT17321.1 hypothetical protein N8J89_29910 [Crossiella sp. CA-258035]
MRFTITKVTKCVGRGHPGDSPPEGTQRRLLWIEVRTGTEYRVDNLPSSWFTQFQAISRQGVTSGQINPSTGWECAPTKDRIGFGDENWLPGKTYAGAIEVYLPDDATKVVNAEGLWEWEL